MLKRSVAIILTVLYLGTVSGFALNLHYCFNRLSSVQIDAPAETCVKSLVISKMKCCSDKHVDIKVKDAHQNGSFSFLVKSFAFDLPKASFADFSIAILETSTGKLASRGPPLRSPNVTLYLKNCTFRI
jgi:hypothetical protein